MASHKNCVILKSTLSLYPRKKRYTVILKRGSLTYQPFNYDDRINKFDSPVCLVNFTTSSVAKNYVTSSNKTNCCGSNDNGTSYHTAGCSTATNCNSYTVSNGQTKGSTDQTSNSEQPTTDHIASNVYSCSPDNSTCSNITNNNTRYNNNTITNSTSYENTVYSINSINLNDVVGCHCYRGKTSDDHRAYFTIYAYPFKKKLLSGRKIRHRISVTFGVFYRETYEDNLRIAEIWKKTIVHLARGKPMPSFGEDIPDDNPRKMLILINPFSGPGKALKLFQQQVAPMFGEADIIYERVITDHAGHAQEIVQTLDISRYYGIVVMSGDGLIFEVINGLMSRPDWDRALKIPIGCIPGGSGNALCCSINYSAGEPILENMVLHSTFILIKHQVLPLDLVAIQTLNQCIYSFLSVTWGFIADIDYESEKYRRSFGSKRFLIQLAQRLFDLRSYRGRLSFIPITALQNGGSANVRKLSRFAFDSNPGSHASSLSGSDCQLDDSSDMDEVLWGSVDGIRIKRSATLSEGCRLKCKRDNAVDIPKNSRHRSETDISFQKTTGKYHRDLSFSSCNEISNCNCLIRDGTETNCDDTGSETFQSDNYSSNKTGFTIENNDYIHLKSQQMITADNIVIQEEILTACKNVGDPVPTPLLPPLTNPLPSNWVVIEDDFISVSASYQTHLGPDFLSAPDSRFNDGIIHLHFIRTGISRNALLRLFRSVEDGSHLDSPFVESIKVLAFRLEPFDKSGNIMVDGERIDYGPIQGQVLPGVSKIMGIQ